MLVLQQCKDFNYKILKHFVDFPLRSTWIFSFLGWIYYIIFIMGKWKYIPRKINWKGWRSPPVGVKWRSIRFRYRNSFWGGIASDSSSHKLQVSSRLFLLDQLIDYKSFLEDIFLINVKFWKYLRPGVL